VLDVRIPPQGPLRSDEAGPDLGYPWALADGVCFPSNHDVLVFADGDATQLDQNLKNQLHKRNGKRLLYHLYPPSLVDLNL
jgi:hypothetical protein